jgi:hypothetical protein
MAIQTPPLVLVHYFSTLSAGRTRPWVLGRSRTTMQVLPDWHFTTVPLGLTRSPATLTATGTGIGAESGTIRIGNDTFVNACYIAGIIKNGPFGADVQIDPVTGQLGSNASSARFKKDIDPMDTTSEAIFSLKPVTFHYKNDETNTPQFGLIAEDVAKVNPALIAVDKEGKPYTVRYNQINAMLLNEFLKEHRKVQEQEATIVQLKKEVETLVVHVREQDSKIQRVSDQVEFGKTAPQYASSNP